MDLPPRVQEEYAREVLREWMMAYQAANAFRSIMLSHPIKGADGKIATLKQPDDDRGRAVMADYIARLTRLYVELKPKVDGSANEELKQEYGKFEPFAYAPQTLYENMQNIFKLEAALRRALEDLKFTEFER